MAESGKPEGESSESVKEQKVQKRFDQRKQIDNLLGEEPVRKIISII